MAGVNPNRDGSIVLVGAASRAGKAIAEAIAHRGVIPVHRGDGPGVVVRDYAEVPRGSIPEGSTVINCVGTPRGAWGELQRINVDVALSWARAAKLAGAAHFIQLSSFSVYGRAHWIERGTPETPASDYGHAKLAADNALVQLSSPTMPITALRIPMLFGDGADKLSQIVRLTAKSAIVPQTTEPMPRSMLSYQGLARAVAALVDDPRSGAVLFADPTPFDYDLLAERISAVTGRRVSRLRVGRLASAFARKFAPSIHARLLAPSFLAPAAALECDLPESVTLIPYLDRLIAFHTQTLNGG